MTDTAASTSSLQTPCPTSFSVAIFPLHGLDLSLRSFSESQALHLTIQRSALHSPSLLNLFSTSALPFHFTVFLFTQTHFPPYPTLLQTILHGPLASPFWFSQLGLHSQHPFLSPSQSCPRYALDPPLLCPLSFPTPISGIQQVPLPAISRHVKHQAVQSIPVKVLNLQIQKKSRKLKTALYELSSLQEHVWYLGVWALFCSYKDLRLQPGVQGIPALRKAPPSFAIKATARVILCFSCNVCLVPTESL